MAKAEKDEDTQWKDYEEVSRYLIGQAAEHFGLERVEEKQVLVGLRSGTEWEIDGKGVKKDGEGIVIIECRRWKDAKQKQEHVGALAYRIIDMGAEGAIIVSPLGIQEGGKKIAAAEKIVEVRLNPGASRLEYMMKFLDKVMIGKLFEEEVEPPDEDIEALIEEKQPDGTITTRKMAIYDSKADKAGGAEQPKDGS